MRTKEEIYDLANGYLTHNVKMSEPLLGELISDLEKLVDEGDVGSMVNLGAIYYKNENFDKATHYYTKAANLGNSIAMSNLGYVHYYGRNTKVDYNKAYYWFSVAAFSGDPVAKYKIGDMFKSGKYVPENFETAFEVYWSAREMMEEFEEIMEYPHDNWEDVQVRIADMVVKEHPFLATVELENTVKALTLFQQRVDKGDWTAKTSYQWCLEVLEQLRELASNVEFVFEPDDDE